MDTYLASIMLWPCNFAPVGWAFCQGQALPINSNQALYSLLGTTYGGDGVTNFKLPNLQGVVIVGAGTAKTGTNYILGAIGGTEQVNLIPTQLPAHNHAIVATTPLTASLNVNNGQATLLAPVAGSSIAAPGTNTGSRAPQFGEATLGFNTNTPNVALNAASVNLGNLGLTTTPAGGSTAHENRQPYIVLNYIIATEGYYPSRPS